MIPVSFGGFLLVPGPPHIPVPVPAGAVQSLRCSHAVSEDPGLTHCEQRPAQRTD